MQFDEIQAWSSVAARTQDDKSIRDHEIYQATKYIPDETSRVLEVNMNSSLYF
jgi:hypothetical protein